MTGDTVLNRTITNDAVIGAGACQSQGSHRGNDSAEPPTLSSPTHTHSQRDYMARWLDESSNFLVREFQTVRVVSAAEGQLRAWPVSRGCGLSFHRHSTGK